MNNFKNRNGASVRRNGREVDVSTLVYGKVPPQARELEEAVLGAIMLQKGAFDTVAQLLEPGCFYVEAHQRIFRAMKSLSGKSQPIDMLTVVEELRFAEELDVVGGPFYVTKLTNAVTSAAHAESWAKIIYQKWLKREQIRICAEGLSDAYEDSSDAFDSLDELQTKFNTLAVKAEKTPAHHISTLLIHRSKRMEELRHRQDHLTGVPTGFKPIDLLTAGWQDTDLIIIAARPSVGKTAFALNIARNAASHKTKPTPVAFFSMEMSAGQVTDRLWSAESGVDLDLIVRAKADDDLMERLYKNGIQPLSQYNLFIDDTPALNINELKAKCRKLKADENIGLVVVDYLQLMTGTGENRNQNREQDISGISRGLKAMAKELKVPVIALSQLSRELEKQKREPQLSDLRESGAIEQDADLVSFLTRPDYQLTEGANESVKDYGDWIVRKHRNGDLMKIPLRTKLNVQRWMTIEEYELYNFNASARNWTRTSDAESKSAKLYVQTGSPVTGPDDDDEPF